MPLGAPLYVPNSVLQMQENISKFGSVHFPFFLLTEKKLLSRYPEMDWKGVMGMRDIIAHHYFDLDAEIVYDVIKNDLPKLRNILQRIINELNGIQ